MFRATKIANYLKVATLHGISENNLLAGTRIDASLVTNQDYIISLEQYQSVVANLIKLTSNAGIAFSLGAEINIAELGILGYALLSSNSLLQATDIWMKYSNAFLGTPINIESYRITKPGYEFFYTSPFRVNDFQRFETEELLVHGKALVFQLTGIEPVMSKVSLSYEKPKHHRIYEEYFKCDVEFGAPHTSVVALRPELDTPIQTRNMELFQITTEHCRKVMASIPGVGLIRSQLRHLFLETPGNLPDLEQAAISLGLSVSTLRRHLKADGLNYQSLKDEFRFDLAEQYLRSGYMTQKQVGYLLGFATPSDFSRAFKTWSGQTIGQFLMALNK